MPLNPWDKGQRRNLGIIDIVVTRCCPLLIQAIQIETKNWLVVDAPYSCVKVWPLTIQRDGDVSWCTLDASGWHLEVSLFGGESGTQTK